MKRKLSLTVFLASLIIGLSGIALAQDLSTVTPPPGNCNGKFGLGTTSGAWVGYVTFTTDCNKIYFSFNLWPGKTPQPTFGNLSIWIGNDLYNLPRDGQGNPNTIGFCSAMGGKCITNAMGLLTYSWEVPLSELNLVDITSLFNTDLYIVVAAQVDMDGNPETSDIEIAFGGSYQGQGGTQYWNYDIFQICCNVSSCNKTAFAKGGYVWTTNPKANPEGLPSLNLTQNRWGWAINLLPGMNTPMTYNIYAGAGLNNTSKGVLVGTLDVLWTGTNVTVKYNMLPGYLIEEVHIYAGDTPPMTIAPGQYGYIDSFDPTGASSVGPVSFAVSDSNGDGIWLVAHAVVKLPCKTK